MTRTVLVLLVALSAPAWASKSRRAAETYARQAERAMATADFEKAIGLLDQAVQKEDRAKREAQLHLLRAQCLSALQKETAARAALRQALEQDAEVALEPSRVSPHLIDLLASVRKDVLGELRVSTTPPGAEVRIDGQPLGPAPLRMAIPVGRHEVSVRTDAGQATRRTVVIRFRQSKEVSFDLTGVQPSRVAEPVRDDADDGSERADAGVAVREGDGVDTVGVALASAGGLLLVAGAAGVVNGFLVDGALTQAREDPTVAPKYTRSQAGQAQLFYYLGWAGVAVGAGAVGYGVYRIVSRGSDGGLAVLPTPGGAMATWSARF